MGCMKCGRDLEEGQIFCEECLADMKQYPVKPGTVVILPKHREHTPVKRPHVRRKVLSPEEQLKRLRRRCRILAMLLALSLIVAGVFGYFAVEHFREDPGFLPGQNYSAIETTTDPDGR